MLLDWRTPRIRVGEKLLTLDVVVCWGAEYGDWGVEGDRDYVFHGWR